MAGEAFIPRWVIYRVSPRALQLYALLGCYANRPIGDEDDDPDDEILAAALACSVHTVRRARDELIEVGALEREPGTNNYTVQIERPR